MNPIITLIGSDHLSAGTPLTHATFCQTSVYFQKARNLIWIKSIIS